MRESYGILASTTERDHVYLGMLGGLGKPSTKINIQLHKKLGKESKTVLDVNVNSIYSP